ncbi:MAG: phosphonoacetaldehyde hydrolase [Planctomycetes bacterium]|nr:phosphonoacetaldehyde hydrolase [Planctomycetota bacterium]
MGSGAPFGAPGGIRLVVADLAGTTVDFGSSAPAGVFVSLFARHGVTVTDAEARGPMGTAKRDHIAALAALPSVAAAWRDVHGAEFHEADLDRLYAEFIPLQLRVLPEYGDLVPGTAETVADLRQSGLRVAVTTGYDTAMMSVVLKAAARQGFVPDAAICASDVTAGRPAPWMIFRAMEACGIWPPQAVVAVGDTIADIEATVNAGAWAVGVTATGNMLGLSKADHDALDPGERRQRLAVAAERMRAAGAHAAIESITELPALLPRLAG